MSIRTTVVCDGCGNEVEPPCDPEMPPTLDGGLPTGELDG